MIYKEVKAADELPEKIGWYAIELSDMDGIYTAYFNGDYFTNNRIDIPEGERDIIWFKPLPDYERGVLEEYQFWYDQKLFGVTSNESIEDLITEYLTNKGE